MREDDLVRLRHMLDAAREAIGFAEGKERVDLQSDRKLLLSLVKEIEIVGEAAYQITESTRQRLPEIPCDDIITMRHRPVHAYFDIDLDIVWRTVQEDLPPLAEVLQRCLAEKGL